MKTVKPDIETREDIVILMEHFYSKLLNDPNISYIFTDVAKIDLPAHLPVIVDFWEMLLFNRDTYRKNAMQVHYNLAQKTVFTAKHFSIWLKLFNETLDECFEGDRTTLARQRALSIATTMQIRIMHPGNLPS